jgi:hypothetical protein
VVATDSFITEDHQLHPWSYNLELAYFINDEFQMATRIEYSQDLIEGNTVWPLPGAPETI